MNAKEINSGIITGLSIIAAALLFFIVSSWYDVCYRWFYGNSTISAVYLALFWTIFVATVILCGYLVYYRVKVRTGADMTSNIPPWGGHDVGRDERSTLHMEERDVR